MVMSPDAALPSLNLSPLGERLSVDIALRLLQRFQSVVLPILLLPLPRVQRLLALPQREQHPPQSRERDVEQLRQ